MSEKLENSAIHAALIQAAASLTGASIASGGARRYSSHATAIAEIFPEYLKILEEKWEDHAKRHQAE